MRVATYSLFIFFTGSVCVACAFWDKRAYKTNPMKQVLLFICDDSIILTGLKVPVKIVLVKSIVFL